MKENQKNNFLKDKTLFFDFDSTFVKVETIDELARISLQNYPEKESKLNQIVDINKSRDVRRN